MTSALREASPKATATQRGITSYILPSLGDVIFILLLVLVPAMRADRLLNADGDMARHITIGRQILETGVIPHTDVFSHTMAGQAYVPKEWLAEVLYAITYQSLGLYGTALLGSIMIAMAFWLVFRFLVWEGVNALGAILLTLLAALSSMMHWIARPHLFTIILALVTFWILERHYERGRKLVWSIPLLVMLWSNLHGGFLVGFILIFIFFGSALLHGISIREFRKSGELAVVAVVSLLASLCNPSGYGVWAHVLSFFGGKFIVEHTQEYMSPDFHQPIYWFFLSMLVLCLLTLALRRDRLQLRHVVILLVWTAFGLYSLRNIPIFAVLVTPILGLYLPGALSNLRTPALPPPVIGRLAARLGRFAGKVSMVNGQLMHSVAPLIAVIIMAIVSANGGYLGKTQVWNARFNPAMFPVDAAEYIRHEQIPGRMFNNFPWGGYLIYTLYPQYQVFIDGQTDFYGAGLSDEYLSVASLKPGWDSILDKYEVNWVIMPVGSRVDVLLTEVEDWRPVYRDRTAVIYVRNTTENAGVNRQISN